MNNLLRRILRSQKDLYIIVRKSAASTRGTSPRMNVENGLSEERVAMIASLESSAKILGFTTSRISLYYICHQLVV
jgi:hypothetical protein